MAHMTGTDVLSVLRSGNQDSLNALVPLLYGELRAIAHHHLARHRNPESRDATLATTALVNEAYLKLVDQTQAGWNDRAHFLALCAVVMRHLLVDRARARARQKRGGDLGQETFEANVDGVHHSHERLLEIDDALDRLSAVAPRLAKVVEYRFYGGLREEEIAAVLSVTVRTVERDWAKARMFLQHALAG